jgi:hypothetical protein
MVAEPVMLNVTEDISETTSLHGMGDKIGWIRTRNTLQRNWKKLFFVLSEGMLSYYESALPRPHRLRGQLVLTDATIGITSREQVIDGKAFTQYVMQVATKEEMIERQLLFQSEVRMLDWTYALECAIKAKDLAKRTPRRRISTNEDETVKKGNRRRSHTTDEETNKSHRRLSSAPLESETPSTKLEGTNLAVQATKDHAASLGLDPDAIENRLALYARKKSSALVVSLQASTEYKICTTDPQGDESEDTWARLRTKFIQNFRITGGHHGRIMRGEELVHVSVVNCIDTMEEAQDLPAEPLSPSRRTSRNRRIFRSFNNSEEGDDFCVASDD